MTARLIIALGALSFAGAVPAFANAPAAQTPVLAQVGVATQTPLVLARHGADDGANHDKGDDRGGKRRGAGHASAAGAIVLARHGADDGADHDANDDHGGRRENGDDHGGRRGRGHGRHG